jgi:hypothetical protein
MQSTFNASGGGQAIIQNTTVAGTEQLVVSLHPEGTSSIDIQIREDVPGSGVISSSISINQSNLQKLVQWLREQGAVE